MKNNNGFVIRNNLKFLLKRILRKKVDEKSGIYGDKMTQPHSVPPFFYYAIIYLKNQIVPAQRVHLY